MKHIFSCVFIFISIGIKAQFSSIANGDSISWMLKHEVWDMAQIESLYLSDTIKLNSKNYYQVYIIDNGSDGLVGYFREDSTTGKTWFWGVNDTTEYLIMDLNLNISDSILIKIAGYEEKYAHVKNIEFDNGRKIITTDYHFGGGFISENLKFIEGIGPNASILYQVDLSTALTLNSLFGYLVCKAYNNSELIYAWDTVHFECGLMWDYIENHIKDQIIIYPNPASQVIKISSQDHLTIEIFDLMGKLILKTIENEIKISNISTGVYLIKVTKENKIIKIKKLIINNVR